MKQRLVGTLVLGCLAIIFIPLLLDGEGISPSATETTAPPAPSLSYQDIALPERPVIEADQLADEAQSAEPAGAEAAPDDALLTPTEPLAESDATETADAAEPAQTAIALPVPQDRVEAGASAEDSTPRRDASGLPEGWTVRLGVFSNPGNADKLRACLIASGYQAYSRTQDGGSMTRVFVGPVATRAEAAALGNRLKGQCELTEPGIPIQYTLQ